MLQSLARKALAKAATHHVGIAKGRSEDLHRIGSKAGSAVETAMEDPRV